MADFPTGWKATPYKADPAEKKSDEEFAACLGIPNPASHTTANIDSPDFSMGDAGASSGAEIVRTVEDFKADTAALDSVKFLPCVKAQLATMLAREIQGASQQSLAVEPLKVAKYGEFSKGIRATSRFKIQGQPVSLYFDVVFLGKERSELTAAFFNVGKPFDPALERALLDRLGARLEAA